MAYAEGHEDTERISHDQGAIGMAQSIITTQQAEIDR
jgi:uncharacterized protein (DUF305 family)